MRPRKNTFHSRLQIRVTPINESHFLAHLERSDAHRNQLHDDASGAVLYVVAVVFIWSLSIFLLIVSYIRKNRMDRNVSLYLKEIQIVRNRSDREKMLQYVNSLGREELGLKRHRSQESKSQRSSVRKMVFSLRGAHSASNSPLLGTSPSRSAKRRTLDRSTSVPLSRPRRLSNGPRVQRIAIPTIFVEESGPDTATSGNCSSASDLDAPQRGEERSFYREPSPKESKQFHDTEL